MDVHALGAPLGAWREGLVAAQCPSILPEVSGYHTGGMTRRKPISLPLQHTYLEVVVKKPLGWVSLNRSFKEVQHYSFTIENESKVRSLGRTKLLY